MKTFKAFLGILAMSLALSVNSVGVVALVGCSGGCASSPSSYKTLKVTQTASVAALESFAVARAKGQVDDATYLKANELYKKYQSAYDAALTAAQLNVNAPTPENVKQLAADFATLVAQVAVGGGK